MGKIASEQGTRWYDPITKDIVEEVPNAKGDRMIKPTLVHARKLGLLRSVTTIGKNAANFGLQKWIVDNTIKTCAAHPYTGSTEEEVKEYIRTIYREADEYKNDTADKGKAIHKSVELAIEKEIMPDDPIHKKISDEILSWITANGITDIQCELALVSTKLGYAGTPDIVGKLPDGRLIIMDLKTTDLSKYKAPHKSWLIQLGAYLGMLDDGTQPELWQIVADRDAALETVFVKHPDPWRWFNAFQALKEYAFLMEGYDPRTFKHNEVKDG